MSAFSISCHRHEEHTAEGTATWDGQEFAWLAYREVGSTIRVMLSFRGKWLLRERGHPLRKLVRPVALQAMAMRPVTIAADQPSDKEGPST